jgi:hypothetical protein
MKFDVYTTTPRDLWQEARRSGRTGQTAAGTAKGGWLAPWGQASVLGKGNRTNRELIKRENAQIPRLIQQLYEGLPPMIRRTPRARYESLVGQLTEFALDSIRATGQVHWPKSIENELKALGWKDGDPRLDRIGTLDGAKRQIEDLAHKYITDYSNKQREKDRHKTALDYHGHYSV